MLAFFENQHNRIFVLRCL